LDERVTQKTNAKKEPMLLGDVIECERCRDEWKQHKEEGVPQKKKLIQHERLEKGTKYITYECTDHKVKFHKNDLEKQVLDACVEFFSKLLDDNYKELYETYARKNIRVLKKQLEKKERELERTEESFIAASTSWIKKNSEYRLKILTKEKEALDELKRELEDLKEQIFLYQTRKVDIQHIKEQVKQVPLLDFYEKKKLIDDLVLYVIVNKNRYCIHFKHPFLQAEGVSV
jgi:small-conductance mechanosensitive channel